VASRGKTRGLCKPRGNGGLVRLVSRGELGGGGRASSVFSVVGSFRVERESLAFLSPRSVVSYSSYSSFPTYLPNRSHACLRDFPVCRTSHPSFVLVTKRAKTLACLGIGHSDYRHVHQSALENEWLGRKDLGWRWKRVDRFWYRRLLLYSFSISNR
jgi:hypothetical protein